MENSFHGDMLYHILKTFDLSARMMLALAWLIAPICSLPQIFVFRLKTHPLMEEYRWIMLLLLLFIDIAILVVMLMLLMVWLIMLKAFN